MTLDEVRAAWHAYDDDVFALDDDDILSLVKSRAARFERQIRRRDWRELTASIVGAVLIGPIAIHAGWLTRAGVVVVLAGLVLIAVKLNRASRVGARVRTDAPVNAVLRAEQSRVDAQIRLLGTVFWWYVLPIAVGSMMIVGGTRGVSWFTAGCALAIALLSWGVVWLNARAVRRTLRPIHDELTELLAQIESPNGSAGRTPFAQESQ
jgi:uncharacterized membrane protein